MRRAWAGEALAMLGDGQPAALVTVAAVFGSAPRDAGTRMIVGRDVILGTIGGGNLEHLLISQGRKLIAQDRVAAMAQDYPLGPMLAQCCGGHVRVLLEKLDAQSRPWLAMAERSERVGQHYTLEAGLSGGNIARNATVGWASGASEGVDLFAADGSPANRQQAWTRMVERVAPAATALYLFGAGHVGRAVAGIASTLPFRLTWFDPRPEMAGRAGGASVTVREDLLAAIDEAPSGAFFLVMTHAHDLDFALVNAILARGDVAYCGLIGSETKRARFVSRLRSAGQDEASLTCPIGAGAVRSKDPACIAVAAAAELLARLESLTISAPEVGRA